MKVPFTLGLLALVTVGPVVAKNTAQPASRVALTAALVEHRSVDLEPYRESLGVDRATYRGRLRSDKAPGQPLVAIPAYAIGRALGADSPSRLRVDDNLTLWLVTVWSVTLPFAALVMLLYLMAARFARRGIAVAVALALGFGTLLLPFADNLFGHILAALLGFGAWFAFASAIRSRPRMRCSPASWPAARSRSSTSRRSSSSCSLATCSCAIATGSFRTRWAASSR